MDKVDAAALDELIDLEINDASRLLTAWNNIVDKPGALRSMLSKVAARGTALRLLLLSEKALTTCVFDDLVELASVGHSDIELCRRVIKSLPRGWLLENIERPVFRILDRSEDEECYRRLAELLREICGSLLAGLVSRALESADAGIREVGHDFDIEHHE